MKVRSETQIDQWDPKMRAHILGCRVELWDGRQGECLEYFDAWEIEHVREKGMRGKIMWIHRKQAEQTAHRQRPPGGIARERATRITEMEEGKR